MMVPEIPSRKLQPRRQASSWNICKARRKLQTLVEQNLIATVEKLAERLGFGYSTIHRHLRAIRKVSKLGQ